MAPMQALQVATLTSAELIERTHDLGRLAPGCLGESSACGRPHGRHLSQDVRFVMKDGEIYLSDRTLSAASDAPSG